MAGFVVAVVYAFVVVVVPIAAVVPVCFKVDIVVVEAEEIPVDENAMVDFVVAVV
jgi:hypothetical protein